MKAPSKTVECAGNRTLTTIVELHDEINTTSSHLKVLKEDFETNVKELKESSKKIFDEDLGYIGDESAPDIYGNHEYLVDGRLVTVNYKMQAGGLSFTKIGGHPAKEVLTKLVGDEKTYAKLFTDRTKLLDDAEKITKVAELRPDLVKFRVDISKLPDKELENLRDIYPEAFTAYVVDESKYIEEVGTAETEVEVQTSTGILATLASLPEDIQYNLRDFTRKVLASLVTSAVKCGNKAEA